MVEVDVRGVRAPSGLQELPVVQGVEWRSIPGFSDYQVSNLGRVRNVKRGRDLKTDKGNRGHLRVRLYANGGRVMRWVHHLVIEAFGDPKPPGQHFVLHGDDDKENNSIGNLRWGTRLDNAEDARKNGRLLTGESNPKAVLDAEKVKEMRRRRKAGESSAALSREFGCSRAAGSAAIRGDTWSHIKDDS